MEEINEYNKGKNVLPIMLDLAKKHNVPFTINNTYGGRCATLHFGGGNFVIWDMPFNINHSGSVKVCSNKDICTYFLEKANFSVPKSENFTRNTRSSIGNKLLEKPIMDFIASAESKGFKFPLMIKPATLSQGVGIVKINSVEDVERLLPEVLKNDSKTFVVQEFCEGNDYRIVTLGDKVIQAYQRIPFHIIGDGQKSIETLIKDKIESFKRADRDKEVSIADYRIWDSVKRANYVPTDVLSQGEYLRLQELANLSLGGESKDCTDSITPYFADIAVNIAKTLNLDMCGIDILATDITDEKSTDYVVLEVNSAPGIDNYLYSNKTQQRDYVYRLYEQVFDFLQDKYSSNKHNYHEEQCQK